MCSRWQRCTRSRLQSRSTGSQHPARSISSARYFGLGEQHIGLCNTGREWRGKVEGRWLAAVARPCIVRQTCIPGSPAAGAQVHTDLGTCCRCSMWGWWGRRSTCLQDSRAWQGIIGVSKKPSPIRYPWPVAAVLRPAVVVCTRH